MVNRHVGWGCVLLLSVSAFLRSGVAAEAAQEKPPEKEKPAAPPPSPAHPAELKTFVEQAQLFHACSEALSRAAHVSYDIRADIKKVDRSWKLTGQVWVAPSPTPFDPAKLKHAFDIKVEEEGRITGYKGAWDGKTLRSSKEGDAEIIVTDFDQPPPRMAFPYEVLDTVLVKLVTQPGDIAGRSDVPGITYEGVKSVDGVECHTLEVKGEPSVVLSSAEEKAEGWERWFINVETKLPLRVERLLSVRHTDGQEESHLAVISRIRVDEPLPENVFSLGQPPAPATAPSAPAAPTPTAPPDKGSPPSGATGKPDGAAPAPPPAAASPQKLPPAPSSDLKSDPAPADETRAAAPKTKAKKKGDAGGGQEAMPDGKAPQGAGGEAGDEKSAADKARREARKEARLDEGDEAPDFELQDAEGKTHRLSQYRGKAVLLNFWKAGCSACSDANPMLRSFREKYAADRLVILGVNCVVKGDTADAAAYVQEQKLNFPQFLDGESVAKLYKVGSQPTFILIGPDGKILNRNSGHFDGMDEPMSKRIEKALKLVKTE